MWCHLYTQSQNIYTFIIDPWNIIKGEEENEIKMDNNKRK